jgi:hypothetical protein
MNTSEFRRLTTEAVAMAEQLEAREQELAAMAESFSQDASAQAAFRDGVHHGRHQEQHRILALIDFHLQQLEQACVSARGLAALRRQVVVVDSREEN